VSAARAALQQAFAAAVAHHQAGQLAEAEQLYRQILDSDPRHVQALQQLALIAMNHGYLDEAEGLLRSALAAAPRNAELHNSLGVLCQGTGRLEEAAECFRTAIRRQPGYAEAMGNLAAVLGSGLRRLSEGVEWARRAAAIKPVQPLLDNLGNMLARLGLPDQAAETFRASVRSNPRAWRTWSSLLFTLHNLPDIAPEELFALHVQVGKGISEGLSAEREHRNSRDPDRRLRVGYVSADFRMSSVSHFALPILQGHDHKAVEVFCYSDAGEPDAVTERFRSAADAWRSIRGMQDEAVAALVGEDGIDILVDLAGHTGNRLAVFARRPAPVQVTYLGYPDTTGLPAMDYRLTDSLADPPGEAKARATETLVLLDPCAWCYAPLGDTPAVAAPRSGPITFGSFNDLTKLSAPALEAWAQILRATPAARLLLKAPGLREPAARERLTRFFQARGIEPARLELHGFLPEARAHLALYGEMDLALDPFPYGGTTTTCDALWMGAPVVSLAGRIHAGRVGSSLLHAVGLGELVASDVEHYIRLAVALAADRDRLAQLRAGLRGRMQRSPLMDAAGFCRRLEAAYREMWHGWCSRAAIIGGL